MSPKTVPASEQTENVLLCIDGQFDFCDPTGSLYVTGADQDSRRLADGIRKDIKFFDRVVATKDSHRAQHIAHSTWWVDENGNHPDPFTLIGSDDVQGANAQWRAFAPNLRQWSEEYVAELEKQGKYKLCIWPRHCLIGSNGHKIQPEIFEAFLEWEDACFATVDYVNKGSSIWTEHYSAFKAEVSVPDDPMGTGPNMALADYLAKARVLFIAGQALSHCVKATIEDIADHFGDEYVKKFALIEDASSPVDAPMFKQAAEDFVNNMVGRGMKLVKSDQLDSVA